MMRCRSDGIIRDMSFLLAAAILAGVLQEGPADGEDCVFLIDRVEFHGRITACDPSGVIEIKEREGGRRRQIVPEAVRCIRFGKDDVAAFPQKGERVYLAQGGMLSGRLVAYGGGTATVETPAGTFRVGREMIRSLVVGPLAGAIPEVKDEKKDVLIREIPAAGGEGRGVEAVVQYGELVAVGDKEVVFRGGKEEIFDRATLRRVDLFNERPAFSETPSGWFAKIIFRNGDRLAGVLRSVDGGRVTLFSHVIGLAEIDRRHIHTISFLRHPRMALGNIIVCDQSGVKEFDFKGREVWSYAVNVQNSGSARRLENGNVLIANTNRNQVLEVEPEGRSGGRILWRLDGLNYPLDAVRLVNGNTLVAEQQAGRVAEYDARTKAVVWSCAAMSYPTAVQRLENGNTLISSFQGVVEVDRQGRVLWTLGRGRVNPWRAQRLEGGNTLVVDMQRNQVVEVDGQSRDVWRMEGLRRPVQALRMEDGNTLILEQGEGRVIEVDPFRRVLERVSGLVQPVGMSAN